MTDKIGNRSTQTRGRLCSSSSVAGTIGGDSTRCQQNASGPRYAIDTVQGAGTMTEIGRNSKVDLIGIGTQFE
jgi:hypothetical protein